MKILISGASGLVGRALTNAFRTEGHAVARLVRPNGPASAGDVRWNPMSARVDTTAMESAEAVVHLSGAGIAEGRWTPERKAVLRSSRVDTTRVLVDALTHLRRRPRVLISASAIGYYGDRGDEVLTESSEPGTDFLALVVRDWEAEAMRAATGGIRTVLLRLGVILSLEGGALPRMLAPFRFGVGGRLAGGNQWMSWIALADVVGIVRAAIENERFVGPLNAVAPNPVRNSEFTRVVAAALHRPAIFPAPAFALRLALGEMADSLLLASQRVHPELLFAAGHAFRFEDIASALRAILSEKH
ncbi:MAG TPA: TIGR01777 family oxidoreductase [Candidatus Acidoferrales bacterium]|nr:TIGR01777 family oxidoreductase [Candidatus Acidoferrales bacterium]